MVYKILLLLLCIVCLETAEQVFWSTVKEMNDVYCNLHVRQQRDKTGCIECGTRAKMMGGKSFSCHFGDHLCLIHDRCLLKYNLSTKDWITSAGWRQFCNMIHVTSARSWIDIGPLLTGRLSIQFSVRGSNDAYFGLSSGNTTASPGYWIILEGFSMGLNCLRDGFITGTCYSQHIGHYLTTTDYVRYWVKWEHGNVRVGIGDSFESEQIMAHQFRVAYSISNVFLKNGPNWIIYL